MIEKLKRIQQLIKTQPIDTPEFSTGLHILEALIKDVEAEQATLASFDPSSHEKVDHYISGLQLIEFKVVTGVLLYTSMPKAKKAKEFAEQSFKDNKRDADRTVKIVQYPVF